MQQVLAQKLKRLIGGEEGFALALTLIVWPVLLILVSGIYVTGETVRRRMLLQNALDAAAQAGAMVQADAISRVAALNRVMAWTYIQANKMDMDLTLWRWMDSACNSMNDSMAQMRQQNQDNSRTCTHAAHKQERSATAADDGAWGWYCGSFNNGRYEGQQLALNNNMRVTMSSARSTLNSVNENGLVLGVTDAYTNIRRLTSANWYICQNASDMMSRAAEQAFKENFTEFSADAQFCVIVNSMLGYMTVMRTSGTLATWQENEKTFLNFVEGGYEQLNNSPGVNRWWNRRTGGSGFRREYTLANGLSATYQCGWKGWRRDNFTGNCVPNGSDSQSVTITAQKTMLENDAFAQPRMLTNQFPNQGAIITGAKMPLANPLAAFLGSLAGSWYDATTVEDTSIWAVSAARAAVAVADGAGGVRYDTNLYAVNSTDWDGVLLPLSKSNPDGVGGALSLVHAQLSPEGWSEPAGGWSTLNSGVSH